MQVPLICHWRGNNDFARAFLAYYRPWVSQFNFILHGSHEGNRAILELQSQFPITVLESYDSVFDEYEKTRRLNEVVRRFEGRWLLLVDSDELVEFPASLESTIRELERSGASCLAAPMLQRLRVDGSLDSPESIEDAFSEFPLCSERLYERLGSTGATSKYPLFRCAPRTVIRIGNHGMPNGRDSAGEQLQGVTHHFKWRRTAIDGIKGLIDAGSPWAQSESVRYLDYLNSHGLRLPLDDAFLYSRDELFRRKLLRKPSG